jgi:hypothetical protein
MDRQETQIVDLAALRAEVQRMRTKELAMKHSRSIESTGSGEDREYALSCSCKTIYRSRLRTYAEAVEIDRAHKAAVADGTWAAEQAAEAARLEALAPLNAAIREQADAASDRQSAAFAYIIAKQNGGDVDAAKAELSAAREREATATASLEQLR